MRQDHELHQRRQGRNMMLGLVLGGFVALVFGVTIVKLSQNESFRGSARTPGIDATVVVNE